MNVESATARDADAVPQDDVHEDPLLHVALWRHQPRHLIEGRLDEEGGRPQWRRLANASLVLQALVKDELLSSFESSVWGRAGPFSYAESLGWKHPGAQFSR